MNEQELHVLRLLTVSAITYAEWKEIIISRMKGNEEIAKLFISEMAEYPCLFRQWDECHI